jgi:hypothetical protein
MKKRKPIVFLDSTREYLSLLKTTPIFRELDYLLPDATVAERLAVWRWIQSLLTQVIHRTIRDLTQPPACPTLEAYRKNEESN